MPDKKPDPMQELKGMHIWMLWEWAADKDGKMTKKPFAANGRACGTDEKFSGRWVTYDEAVAAMKRFPGRAAGVGFKVPGGYFFLDVDDLASAPFAFILLYSIEELMRDNRRMMRPHEDLFVGIM